MHYLDNFFGLGKQVYYICIVRILFATGCIVSFMTTLLYKSVLGMSSVEAGIYISLGYFFSVVGTLIGGKAADKFSRKRTAEVLIAVTGLCIAASAFCCRSKLCIPLLTFAFAASYAGFPVLSAMVADSCKPENSQESFSLMYLGQNIGFALGPALGGLLFYKHLEGMFWVGAAINLAAFLFIAVFVKNTERKDIPVYHGQDTKGRGTLSLMKESKPLMVFVGAMFMISVCYCMLNFIMSLHLADLFGLEKGSAYSGYIWTVNGVCVILLTPLIVNYTKRHHQFSNMVIALLLYCIGFGSYAFTKSAMLFFVSSAVWTAGEIMINTGSAAFIAANSPPTHVARFQSIMETATACGKTVSPIIYGWLLTAISYETCWKINGAVCLILSFVMLAAYKSLILKGEQNE